ncbi:MAG: bifunctional 2-polyprenyl-6-hydroxyphenol methylase/3-demethylubiquinol 3-O-methyltransferase UbiG [Neisseriaceae bacterium]|nr:MAG: bifunctional 2-polyprenyl-6-hydroxyphenol methylase/3-demethylubiquinol 3-O-methyltransferase UbiG [Neisseriaceae bacterium]
MENDIIKANISHEEVDKFGQLADKWWDRNGPLKSLHDINPLRFSFIQKYTGLNNKNILDVGCGGGILTESLAKSGGKITGIDLAYDSIEVAKLHAERQDLAIDYQVIDVEQLSQEKSDEFDVITCMELLEHVPEPERLVKACTQLLKPNGLLFMSTINKNIKSYLQAIIVAEYILKLVPKKTHEHSKFITPATLARMARNNNLDIEGMSGFSYNPITQDYFLTPKVDVNYMIVFRKKNNLV